MNLGKVMKEFEAWGDTHWGKGDWDYVPGRELLSSLEAWKHQQKKIDELKTEIGVLKSGSNYGLITKKPL